MSLSSYRTQFPFLSIVTIKNQEYLTVIDIQTKTKTAMYMIKDITCKSKLNDFFDICATWWWQSNRNIPLSLFMRTELEEFNRYRRVFVNKALTLNEGHVVSLNHLQTTRIKRKNVVLKGR